MRRYFLSGCFLFLSAALVCAVPSPTGSNQTPQSQAAPSRPAAPAGAPTAAPTASPAGKTAEAKDQTADKNSAKAKKKPKKVWTEDDISKAGNGGISVVGDSSSSGSPNSSSEQNGGGAGNSAQSNDVQYYRDALRQLQAQLDVTDKKIEELRNFRGDNTSASGGINPNNGYSMTPVADQIKQLEDKKKQIQDQIDAITDEARKKGIEPGQLR